MTTIIPQCAHCKHFIEEDRTGLFCAAFPVFPGIPLEIWTNEVEHTSDYPGDGGVHYEADESSDIYQLVHTSGQEGAGVEG